MASLNPCSAPEKRAKTTDALAATTPNKRAKTSEAVAAIDAGVLPLDLLCDVLLRLPAKKLCQVRTVCRAWWCVLSAPTFVAAHTHRRPATLLVVVVRVVYPDSYIDITNLPGDVVKLIRAMEGSCMSCIRLGLVSLVGRNNTAGMLNPATVAASILPDKLAHRRRPVPRCYTCSFAVGQITATGEYEVLRILECKCFGARHFPQLCEVFTLVGNDKTWRARRSPRPHINTEYKSRVVVEGVVYFLLRFTVHGIQGVSRQRSGGRPSKDR